MMRPYGGPDEPTFLSMNDGVYRYLLTRKLSGGKRTICWVMLNPSTADESRDDPTLRRVIGFSQGGFDRVLVVNLFAKRSTDPSKLFRGADAIALSEIESAIGPSNDLAIAFAARGADVTVAAWGSSMQSDVRWRAVHEILHCHAKRPIYCLGLTNNGQPRHPLYVPRKNPFVPFIPPPARSQA